MRLERVEIDGFGPLSGSFWFPENGIGIWAAPNGSGKSVLIEAIAAALYGQPDPERVPSEAESPSAWIMVHLTRDDGRSLVVARDLRDDTVQVTDGRGDDVTVELCNRQGSVGEKLLSLSREDFLEVVTLGPDALATTAGNRVLQRLLKGGRSSSPSRPSGRPDPSAVPGPIVPSGASRPEAAPSATAAAPKDDLQIVHSAAEELGYAEPGSSAELSIDSPLDLDVGASPVETTVGIDSPPDPDEPGLDVVERVRRMREGIARLATRLNEKREEQKSHSDRVLEYQTERERLGTMTGAEPGDLEGLGGLLGEMKEVRDRKERLRIEEQKIARELEERKTSMQRLLEIDARFHDLETTHREFLDQYQQAETLRRGNLTLIRSESRFDEKKLEEIAQDRRKAARFAAYPLTVSLLGVGGEVFLRFFPFDGIPQNASLGFALVCALGAAISLLRARRRREGERRDISTALERKQEQLEQLEKESKYVLGQLHVLAEERNIGTSSELLQGFQEWKEHSAEVGRVKELRRRLAEVDLHVTKIGEKLATFGGGGDTDTDPLQRGAQEIEAMYRDYSRFFEVSTALEAAGLESTRLEEDLAGIEAQTSDLRRKMFEILRAAGIDPEAGLDEAIATLEARHQAGEIVEIEVLDSLDTSPSPAALDDIDGDTSWISPLSARAEAILRRFLPEVREVEVDDKLRPSLKLDARGARLGFTQLTQHLSAASIDQVCLALRLAIVETLSSSGEAIPVFLDDPLIRADDGRHDRALDFLVTDACQRGQVVLLTAQEVRTRWFLHQFPEHHGLFLSLREPSSSPRSGVSSTQLPSPSS